MNCMCRHCSRPTGDATSICSSCDVIRRADAKIANDASLMPWFDAAIVESKLDITVDEYIRDLECQIALRDLGIGGVALLVGQEKEGE